jgi:uncharacterized protein YdeI (YjbR/CyaY-like superfamily)
MPPDMPELVVADASAWRGWLAEHHARSGGVWLTLAKQGTTRPTSLTYAEALEEALSQGWIDGQLRSGDDTTYTRRFTPRRVGSAWSKRNVGIVEQLMRDGRMQPAGIAEVDRAKEDGRWSSAYAGSASIEVPPDLEAALRANKEARAMFDSLDRQNRYAILYRIGAAKRADTRARRIEQFVAMLARGETIHGKR